MNTVTKRFISVLAWAAMAVAPHAMAQAVNVVLLAVDEDESALTYNANGSSHGRCQQSSEPGCVRVSGRAQIMFKLVNKRQCGAGGFWELSGVQLGGETGPGENVSAKPAAWGGLSATAAADFGADAASGQISTGRGQNITIQDANSAAYSLWYRVQAVCGADTIYFDPRFENDGTGN